MTEINFADAQQAFGFLVPQQYRIEAEIYRQKYPSYDYSRLMFTNTDGDMWDIGSVFYSGDIAGQAKFLAGAGFDMPFADVSTSQYIRGNHFAGIGYEWFLQELERAARVGRNLGNEKAMAASKVAEQFIYGIAIRGNAEKGITGLVNDVNVPAVTAAADGTGAFALWSTKTADQINRDVNVALESVTNNSRETEIASKLALPTSRLQYLSRARVPDSAVTIAEYIKKNNWYTTQTGQPLDIIGTRELETAGAGGTARMMAYSGDKDVVQFHLPGPHRFLPVFQKAAMTWEVGGIMNVGGTEIRRPKGMVYVDGI